MLRWIFFTLLLANFFPFWLSTKAAAPATEQSGGAGSEGRDSAAAHIRLLDEAGGGEADVRPRRAADADRASSRCLLVGPLTSAARVEALAGRFQSAGFPVERHWREVSAGRDYWVYLPRQPSARATTRTLQELAANNIDGFIFSEGELKGAIALGAFTDQGRAETAKTRFEELGYDAQMREIDRLAREYWLTFEGAPVPDTLARLLDLPSGGAVPQKISRMPCKTVASAMHFQ